MFQQEWLNRAVCWWVCSQELCRRTKDGNTALHLCAIHDKPESLKLLLRCRSDLVNYENMSGLTARDIAQNNGHQLCIELVSACCCLLYGDDSAVVVQWNCCCFICRFIVV